MTNRISRHARALTILLGVFSSFGFLLINTIHSSLESRDIFLKDPSIPLGNGIKHLAMLMDGNRRWARQRGLEPTMGHKEGVKTVERVINFCLKHGIKTLSLYTFSLENFKRSEGEKQYLFSMIPKTLDSWLDKIKSSQIKIRALGDKTLFPPESQKTISEIEDLTKDHEKLTVNLMFCYGSKQEIVNAAKSLATKVVSGDLNLCDINEKNFTENMWAGEIGQPDLVVRTGGRNRLSNFLLFQVAYSELIFTDIFWPDITEKDLEGFCRQYYLAERTFGS